MKPLEIKNKKLTPLSEKKESKKEEPSEDEQKGLSKDVFLYMENKSKVKEFAQCGNCKLYMTGKKRCSILGNDKEILATDSCGLYVNGTPSDNQEVTSTVTPEEVGLVHTKVRCENCHYFASDGDCLLFRLIGIKNYKVKSDSCCNAWSKKG